jgi:hypothetical protein
MSIILDSVTLPDDLLWSDEHAWAPVQQTAARRLDGGLVVFALATPAGRPITLDAREDAWLTRTEAEALATLAARVGEVYLLTLRGETRAVMFRHQDAPAVDLRPLVDWNDSDPDDPFVGQIKLMTV